MKHTAGTAAKVVGITAIWILFNLDFVTNLTTCHHFLNQQVFRLIIWRSYICSTVIWF